MWAARQMLTLVLLEVDVRPKYVPWKPGEPKVVNLRSSTICQNRLLIFQTGTRLHSVPPHWPENFLAECAFPTIVSMQ